MRLFASARTRRLTAAGLLLFALALVVVYQITRPFHALLLDPAALRPVIASYGAVAPLVLILVLVIQIVVAPVPNQVAGVISGYLFGPVYGTLYTFIGTVAGIVVAVFLARKLGRPFVERVVHPDTLAGFDGEMERYGLPALLLAFVTPIFPDDAVCLVAGLSTLRFRTILLVAAIGRLPGIILVNVVGDGLATRPWFAIPLIIVAAAGWIALYRWHDQIHGRLKRVEHRLFGEAERS